MKKQTTSTGPTGFGWARSLLTFRHGNPVGRLVSTLLAFAIATLLVAGTSAAYADDTQTTPTDTTSVAADPTPDPAPATDDSSTPAADDSSTPAADDSSTPAADDSSTPPADTSSTDSSDAPSDTTADSASGSTSDGATGDAPASTGTSKHTASMMTTLKTLATADVVAPSLCGADVNPVLVGTFEIDGNTCVTPSTSHIDWDSNVPGMLYNFDDAKDHSAYTQGDSENNDPATFHTGGSSQGKDDITDAWSYTKNISGDVWTFFGMKRVSKTGTTTYDVELNHLANDLNAEQRPVRTPATHEDPSDPTSPLSGGDLLLQFEINGNGPLTFDKGYQWTAKADFDSANCFEADSIGFGWCPLNLVTPPNFQSSHSTDGLFAEGAINLSELAKVNGETCSGSFGVMNIRTVASEEHTAALQDYVAPFPTNIPSSCPSLVIQKFGGGSLLTGAHFNVYTGATATAANLLFADVSDGTAPDSDSVAGQITIKDIEPGTYTVKEITAPTGYLLPPDTTCTVPFTEADACRTETATADPGTSGGPTFKFYDVKAWDALTVDKTAHGTYTLTYPWKVNKQISETGEPDSWVDGTSAGSPLAKSVGAGGDTSLYYQVVVDHDGEPVGSDYVVKGIITVTNGNDGDVAVTLTDSLSNCTLDDGGASISGAGAPVTANKNGDTTFAYTCDLGDTAPASTLKNSATITWSMDDYPQATAGNVKDTNPTDYTASKDDVDFQPFEEKKSVDKSVDVVDDNGTPVDTSDDTVLGTVDWADAPWTSAVYSNDPAPEPGTCSAVITNTASILGDGVDPLGHSSESGQVCQDNAADLTVGATVQESLVRTYPWSIDKATSTPSLQNTGGPVVAHYTVTVTAGDLADNSDSDYAMSGTVRVDNPNDFESVDLTDVTVDYTGATGETCTVSPDPTTGLSVPASDHLDFTFTCEFTSPPSLAGSIVATASWDGAKAGTSHSSAQNDPGTDTDVLESEWSVSPVNETVNVWDDNATPGTTSDDTLLGTPHWADVHAMEKSQQQFTYSITLTGMPAAGACNTHTNTAKILGDDGKVDDDTADVRVCTPAVAPPIVSPPEVLPPSLPDTGGPDAWLMAAGLGLVLAGGLVLAAERRRKRRS